MIKNILSHFELSYTLNLNPRKFWSVTNLQQTHRVTLSNDLGQIISDSESANIFHNEISYVSMRVPEFQFPMQPSSIQYAMLPIIFIADDIYSIIENMKPSSSTAVPMKLIQNFLRILSIFRQSTCPCCFLSHFPQASFKLLENGKGRSNLHIRDQRFPIKLSSHFSNKTALQNHGSCNLFSIDNPFFFGLE